MSKSFTQLFIPDVAGLRRVARRRRVTVTLVVIAPLDNHFSNPTFRETKENFARPR